VTASIHPEARFERPERLPTPQRVLTIGAHHDDAEFGCGGTLAKWAEDGAEISMLIITDGSKGTWDESMTAERLAAIRRQEQQEAARVLGAAGRLVFLDRVDGELSHDTALQEELCLWIRRLRPDVVLGFDPWKRYMMHPDHRAAGWAVIDAVVAARDHLFFPHQLDAATSKHRPAALLLWSADEPDYWEDISATFERKIDALLCHRSQAHSTMQGATENGRAEFVERMRVWAENLGRPAGLALGESFKLLTP
jgi:LmbE family N-acetylglucosaminyl deacetylase